METTYLQNLKSMRDAITLQTFIEQEQDHDEFDRMLFSALHGYIQELRYRLGLVKPYSDDLNRLAIVKDVMRGMDPIFDRMTELADGESLPPAAFGLWTFLWQIALDLASVIRAIEAEHPELESLFQTDREYYAKSREGEEALRAWMDE
jgi:hypothetical protein